MICLVDNAIKFSEPGGKIRIRVSEQGPSGVIDVIDTGIGVDPAHRAHIFDRFYRVSEGSAHQPGSGLGLSLAKSAVEVNGGRLTLEDSSGQGSTFRIAIPIMQTAARKTAAG